jgi:Flp pilus assembly protein TadG
MRIRREDGASAVEFALVAPLLFMLVFGITGFGLAFLQVQSIRTAVREGGRAGATGASVASVQQTTVNAASNAIPSGQTSLVAVSAPRGGFCNPNNIGDDITVAYNTANLPGGGVIVRIPLIPDIVMRPVISASFRCEV